MNLKGNKIIKNLALRFVMVCAIINKTHCEVFAMESAEMIRNLRESTGLGRKEFSIHTGIPVRTLEDWEAGRRTPPEYIPRLIAYQLKFEKLVQKLEHTTLLDEFAEEGAILHERPK